ncbi:MAG TPA: zf-HC2 domain-containing protein [Candidatus Limnocylindrales bacterium]|nr:zf-HC2 domain-containing protein [Candidatus Limnocylindrales bacterium]
MTLPFRRRHHDNESSHDRARSLISAGLDGLLETTDQAWLEAHLARCPECTFDAQAYRDDRVLLRGLRDNPPVAPRDLWARTSAAIERESQRGRAGGSPATRLGTLVPARQRVPLGVLSGGLVVLVVAAAVALVPGGTPVPPAASGGSSLTAVITEPPGPTQIAIPNADSVAWIQRNADGSYALIQAPVSAACPTSDPACAPLPAGSPTPLELGGPPQDVVLSPDSDQVAVIGPGGAAGGTVLIVSVPSPAPSGSAASPSPSQPVPTTVASRAPVSPAPPTQSPTSSSPASSSEPSIAPSVEPVSGGHAIISGVQVVGGTAYSASGDWLAFSAKPIAGGGPFLYAWHVGDDQARQLTFNGETYFSGWFGDEIVASEVLPVQLDAGAGSPAIVGAPRSFLLDPATGLIERFRVDTAWLPSIDPTGRFVTYWAGDLLPVFATDEIAPSGAPATPAPSASEAAQSIIGWRLGQGTLVLDGWSAPLAATAASTSPGASTTDSSAGSSEPSQAVATPELAPSVPGAAPLQPSDAASAQPETPAVGPAGTSVTLATTGVSAFDARFDPDGTKLAIWVADGSDSTVGRLWLDLLDPVLGAIRTGAQPLPSPGVPALHGFSLLSGRLGWVTPAGQDGQLSSVHILAWSGDDFGQVQTVPGGNPQIVR